jgi:hypothetical protein
MLRCIYSQLILRELFYCLADFSNTLLEGSTRYRACSVCLLSFSVPLPALDQGSAEMGELRMPDEREYATICLFAIAQILDEDFYGI